MPTTGFLTQEIDNKWERVCSQAYFFVFMTVQKQTMADKKLGKATLAKHGGRPAKPS